MSHLVEDDEFVNDTLEDMIRDIGVDDFKKAGVIDTFQRDIENSLYPGCKSFTRMTVVLRLFNLKVIGGWMDKSFIELLELLKVILPGGNTLSNYSYEAKKILCPMSLDYVKIHASLNDYILFRK